MPCQPAPDCPAISANARGSRAKLPWCSSRSLSSIEYRESATWRTWQARKTARVRMKTADPATRSRVPFISRASSTICTTGGRSCPGGCDGEDDEGEIVREALGVLVRWSGGGRVRQRPGLEPGEQGAGKGVGGEVAVGGQERLQPVVAEKLAGRRHRLGDAVGEDQEPVAGLERGARLGVVAAREAPQDRS